MEYHLTVSGGGMEGLFHGERFGRYWLRLLLTDRLYLGGLIAVIILALLIMRVRRR